MPLAGLRLNAKAKSGVELSGSKQPAASPGASVPVRK